MINRRLILKASILAISCGLIFTSCSGQNDTPIDSQKEITSSSAESPAPRVMVHQNGNSIRIGVNENVTFLELCKDNILKVNYLPEGVKGASAGVVGRSSWTAVDYSISDTKENPLIVETDKMKVEFDAVSSSLKVYDVNNNLVLTQNTMGDSYSDNVSFTYEGQQNFYGINGYSASETSKKLLLRNKGGRVEAGMQGDSGAPLIWTTSGYGLLFDSAGGFFRLRDNDIKFSGNTKRDMEYYIILGNPESILKGVADVSGKPPMFPKWAMGFTNSEWGMDQAELESIVSTYREKNFPIDNYTLDFDWKAWGEDNYGEFRWNDEKFPDGPSGELAERLSDQGIKLTGIMKPRILTGTVQGDYALKHGYFYPNKKDYKEYFSQKLSNDIDFSNPVARSWYFDHAKEALDTGFVGWWNDEADELGNNLQHMYMQMALYQGQRGYNNERVWSINRNFYLGAQRYAYGLWSGDINSGFKSMKMQRERLLSNVLLGQMKWGMDTGGFNGADPSPENYTRWIQFSAFTPIFRVHSRLDKQRQPWLYGEVAEVASREAMNLRYRLLPYVYSYERRAYDNGIGLVKPLVMVYPDDQNVANLIDSWMFGDHLLVSPVLEQGQSEKEIYLPEGEWIDFFRGTTYEGGQTIKYSVDADSLRDIPLFIKSGAIIPTVPNMDYIGQRKDTEVTLDIYPSSKNTYFDYYEDDGKTYEYEDGVFYKRRISLQKNDSTTLSFSTIEGDYIPDVKSFKVRLHSKDSIKDIVVNGTMIENFETSIDDYGNIYTISVDASSIESIEYNRVGAK